MNADIQTKLANLPDEAGVYIMMDAQGNILYVGKAKILKNRVRQYFFASTNKTDKVLAMLSHVADFRYIITASEADALSLENTLIKKHNPPYNILLKDDKQYPYIKVDLSADYPKFVGVRRILNDKCKYFGPITSGGIKSMLDILRQVFPTITCNYNFDKLPKNFRPCLDMHIGTCCAPCVGKVTKEQYRQIVNDAVQFLSGDDSKVLDILRDKMQFASERMQYEQALRYRNYIAVVEKLRQRRIVVLNKLVDYDMFAIAGDGSNSVVNHTMIRAGKVVYSDNFDVCDAGIDEAQTLSSFLAEYCPTANISKELFVNIQLDDSEQVAQFLSQQTGKTVTITCPQRQDKKKLVDMSYRNAVEYLTANSTALERKYKSTVGAMEQLQQLLGLTNLPHRIECYDISNISGVDKVSSMVVFTNGSKDAKQYRRFRIRTVEGANDFASMKETLVRRMERLNNGDERFGKRPDLIVVDGGLGQLGYAQQAIQQCGQDIELISLAKQEELVFTTRNNQPIALPRNSYALNLLINIRDEAHRFAITYFRKLHGKNALKSVLQEIDGIGEKRQKALYRHFKTIDAISNATVEELSSVNTMTMASANKVYDYFHTQSISKEYGEQLTDTDAIEQFDNLDLEQDAQLLDDTDDM